MEREKEREREREGERERKRWADTPKRNRQKGRQNTKNPRWVNGPNSCLTSAMNGVMPTIYKFNQRILMFQNKCTHSRWTTLLTIPSHSLSPNICRPSTIDQSIVRAFLSQLETTHSLHAPSIRPLSRGCRERPAADATANYQHCSNSPRHTTINTAN